MNIEDLIKNRKNKLDVEQAPPELWDKIKSEWKDEKQPGFSWWKAAAIIAISLSIGLLIHNQTLQNKVDQLASLGDLSEEYRVVEQGYITQINQLESTIPIGSAMEQEDFEWIFEELNMLDEINEIYRSDIGKINEEELVGVLIDYYEKKIRLLRKLELEIERTNKIEQDETTNTDSITI